MADRYQLNETLSPIEPSTWRELNENWELIKSYLRFIQRQINIISGSEADEIISKIEATIANAENATADVAQAKIEIELILNDLTELIANTQTAANNANLAANEANELKNTLTALQGELVTIQTNLNGIVEAESQRVLNEQNRKTDETTRRENEAARVLKEQSRENAEQDRKTTFDTQMLTAEQKITMMQYLIDNLKSYDFDLSTTYNFPNLIKWNGSTFIALKEVIGLTPVDDGINYRLVAQRGVDGTGAVSSVNGNGPDANGNVEVIMALVNNLVSDSTTAGLTAAQGKALKILFDGLQQALDTHVNNIDNPHGVTAEQLALGNLQNFGVATQAEAEEGIAADKYMTAQRTKQAVDKGVAPVSQAIIDLEEQIASHMDDNIIHRISITSFGAKFDGNTDDTQAFKDAIDYLEALGGGELYLPVGISIVTDTIRINQPIYIIGQGKGGDSNNTNGSGTGTTTVFWGANEAKTMFEFVSTTSKHTLIGGGIKNLLLDGNNIAARGVNVKSCGYMKFQSFEGRRFVSEFMLIDDSNGVLSQFNVFEDIHYVYGAGNATENSHGLVFYGSSEVGVTQNHIISIAGLMYNGYALVFKTSDNNIVEKCHAVAIGLGGSIYFANGIYSDSNVINYLVGKVKSDSNAKGNRITHWNSEGGGLTLAEGSVIHYEVYDYQHCDIFETHKYYMADRKNLTIGDIDIVDGGAVKGIVAGHWGCINLPNAVDSRISCVTAPEYKWNDGVLQIVRVRFSQDTSNPEKQFAITLKVLVNGDNSAIHEPEYNQTILVNASALPYMNSVVTIPVNLNYTRNDSLFISIVRNGNHSNDTAEGNMQILSMELLYQSTGPNSGGSGLYPTGWPSAI